MLYYHHSLSSICFIILFLCHPQIHPHPHFHLHHPHPHPHRPHHPYDPPHAHHPHGIEPGTFFPGRTMPRPPSKRGWDNSSKGLPNVPKNSRKTVQSGETRIPKFSAKWIQDKIHVPRFSGNYIKGSRSKKSSNLNKMDSSKKANNSFCQRCISLPWELLTFTCFWDPRALLNFFARSYVIICLMFMFSDFLKIWCIFNIKYYLFIYWIYNYQYYIYLSVLLLLSLLLLYNIYNIYIYIFFWWCGIFDSSYKWL